MMRARCLVKEVVVFQFRSLRLESELYVVSSVRFRVGESHVAKLIFGLNMDS